MKYPLKMKTMAEMKLPVKETERLRIKMYMKLQPKMKCKSVA